MNTVTVGATMVTPGVKALSNALYGYGGGEGVSLGQR